MKKLYQMVAKDIDALLKGQWEARPDVRDRIMYYSELALGTPYVKFCLGEGPDAPYDQDPLMDMARVDCMTFCEQILALAISRSYPEAFHNLQRIRYRRGKIDFTWRNHYTIADWLPNNAWLLEDVTDEVGGSRYKSMTKTVDRRKMLRDKGCTEVAHVPEAQQMTTRYIPKEAVLEIADRLEGGEIVSLITSKPGIFSSHMGLIARNSTDALVFRHASSDPEQMQVVDVPFSEFPSYLARRTDDVGLKFMRVRPSAVSTAP
jgi:hypothetical protein